MKIKLKTKIFDKAFIDKYGLPTKGTPGSVGYDISARLDNCDKIVIQPNETCKVGTGFAIKLDTPTHVLKLWPRSGAGTRGLILGNSVGLIDSDFRKELILCLWNRTDKPITICHGDKVAQYTIEETIETEYNLVDEFDDEDSVKRVGGLGSTGGFNEDSTLG